MPAERMTTQGRAGGWLDQVRRLRLELSVHLTLSLQIVLLAVFGAPQSALAGRGGHHSGVPRHVILMIADGASFNSIDACSYYQYGQLGQQPYDSFPVQLACSTYMLNQDGTEQGYESKAAWTDFRYLVQTYTDSAAAATALHTGVKTTGGRVNTDSAGG